MRHPVGAFAIVSLSTFCLLAGCGATGPAVDGTCARGQDLPLIPQGEMAHLKPVPPETLELVREKCSQYIPQSRHCKQCRADAIGIPGLETRETPCLSGKNL